MVILPAIDLYKGEVVRLIRGDYSQMTVYSSDPVFVARGFKDAGAVSIHIVDLEGARDGRPANFDVIKRIAAVSGLDIQVGGGVRSADIFQQYLDAGVKRVILGTAAATAPGFIPEMVRLFGDAVAVGVDIMDGRVAIKGWTELSSHGALDFCREAEGHGVRTLICTDISKDGMLGGTNMELYRTMRKKLTANLIASGGISSIKEIKALSELGMDGAILGKALYAGEIRLEEAINELKSRRSEML
ncbi:MAG: 1-(5-phosphoribosyl)-5-[(5-phosphoribosylamino)methylideneamino]imidazole-4-carboxamide isomerase [Oscillospiraceae bacterium]|jgi:phosphoribosylformimino-5-aminoimidazole carboxamide ribotide isomerase|nr:1-(5-phosphoribosyl)-5-[(5-phosphoribosylamino)methylideneamino]imidazole-4-carboxamide isomerase [Oscillospiraceae bacterium]